MLIVACLHTVVMTDVNVTVSSSLLQFDKLSAVTGHAPSSLSSCLSDLLALFSEAATLPHPAVREKYAKDKYGNRYHVIRVMHTML